MSRIRKDKTKNKKIKKALLLFILTIFSLATVKLASNNQNDILIPDEKQYFELRAVEINNVEGQNKQVIMELWGNNLEFKRI